MSQSWKVFETYDEVRQNPSTLKEFFEKLSCLTRPQMVVDDVNFLDNFSLKAQKLTLRDIVLDCMLKNSDTFVEFPLVYSDVHCSSVKNTERFQPKTPTSIVQLNKDHIEMKCKQLRALIQLYEKEIQWLSSGSRLFFGRIANCNSLSIFIDFSYEACFKDSYASYLESLGQLLTEQIQQLCEVPNINLFGSSVTHLVDTFQSNEEPFGTCNFLAVLQFAMESAALNFVGHTLIFIVSSMPNQSLDVLYDYATQIFSGSQAQLHFVSFDVDTSIQSFLRKLSVDFNGHYHEYNQDHVFDTLIEEIERERERAHECILNIEDISQEKLSDSFIECLKELSLVVELHVPTSSLCHASLHSIPCSTTQWLKGNGLDSHGLDLYDVLEPDTYTQLSEYIPVVSRTAFSTVYDVVMPTFVWKDGSKKYLHVDVNKLIKYENDLKIHCSMLHMRLTWLQSNSRIVFGNLAEEKVLIVLDCSNQTSLHTIHLKHHLKMLLQEQLFHKSHFNLIRYSGNEIMEYSDTLCYVNEDTLADAWRWILNIRLFGNNSLLHCLDFIIKKYTIPSHDNNDGSPIGIYLVLSSVPDQDIDCISSYIEQKLCGLNIQLNIILYQPNITYPEMETVISRQVGVYGEEKDLSTCAVELSENGTLHMFKHGKFQGSNDHSELVEEISKTRIYLKMVQDLLDNYRIYCKRFIPSIKLSSEESTLYSEVQLPIAPFNPQPTLTSIARMNFNMINSETEIKNEESLCKKLSLNKRKLSISYTTFYTGRELEKILLHKTTTQSNMKLKPSATEHHYQTSHEWLKTYSLASLGLSSKRLLRSPKNGFRHIAANGSIVTLSINRQQLNDSLLKIKNARLKYCQRMEWLLQDSRLVFGCITEKKVVLLIDLSISMEHHISELKEHIRSLLDEQLSKGKRQFSVVSYGERINVWKQSFSFCTKDNALLAHQWISHLSAGGSSNMLHGLKTSLELFPDATVYIISDGSTDHSHKYMQTQIQRLRDTYKHNWKINTVAYLTEGTRAHFLEQLAHSTEGRYHSYPVPSKNTDSSLNYSNLGDDLKLVVEEIQAADSAINQILFYMGRSN